MSLVLRAARCAALIVFALFSATAATAGTVAAPDGTSIHFTDQGEGSPALVFIHGWSCDAGYWDAQVKHFAAAP